jgi:hypothetical protein
MTYVYTEVNNSFLRVIQAYTGPRLPFSRRLLHVQGQGTINFLKFIVPIVPSAGPRVPTEAHT